MPEQPELGTQDIGAGEETEQDTSVGLVVFIDREMHSQTIIDRTMPS